MTKYAQPILFFFCRPCGEYHEKTHPRYHAMKRRNAKHAKKKAAAEYKQRQKASTDEPRWRPERKPACLLGN
jgi:hypothetical protein